MDLINSVTNWQFLDEPLYRWALFLIALTFITWGWNGVLAFMKS